MMSHNIDICIYHPYNQECMLNINVMYDNITNKLDNIIYKTKIIIEADVVNCKTHWWYSEIMVFIKKINFSTNRFLCHMFLEYR